MHLFTVNAQKAGIYALVDLVDLAAGIEAVMVCKREAIIALLAIKACKCRGIALTVRAVGMRMEIRFERKRHIEILVERVDVESAEDDLVALKYDLMLLLTAKAIVKLQQPAVRDDSEGRSYCGVIIAHVVRVYRNDRNGIFRILDKGKRSLKRCYRHARGLVCGKNSRIG